MKMLAGFALVVVTSVGCSKARADAEYNRCMDAKPGYAFDNLHASIDACRAVAKLDPKLAPAASAQAALLERAIVEQEATMKLRSASCESMCEHALQCVCDRIGTVTAGQVYDDARANCIAGCRGAPLEKIACWQFAPCDKIEREQGLTRKPCP